MARFSQNPGGTGSGSALNYVQVAGTQQTISSAPSSIVDLDITTTGAPVQISVTGEGANAAAGSWVKMNLFRDEVAIGNEIQIESSAISENVPFAINFIDDVDAGTYNYSARITSKSSGNWQFGEVSGPVINAVELTGFKGDTGETGPAGEDGSGAIADFIFTNNGGDSTITLPGAKELSIISGEEEDLYITAGDDLWLTALDDDVHIRANDDVKFVSGYENGGTEYEWSMDSDGRLNLPGEGYISNPADSSGDGNNYDTIQIVPDDGRYGSDQYLIIDPTEPNHIHVRAGGTIDESLADLILGGEDTQVKISDADGSVSILADNININSNASPSTLNINTYSGAVVNSNRTSAYPDEDKVVAVLGDLNADIDGNSRVVQATRKTSATWASENPVLAAGQAGIETDTSLIKYGDGNNAWNALPYESSNHQTYLVRNTTGSTIPKGTLVYASGVEAGGRINVSPFATTGLENSEVRVMGVAFADLPSDGSNGNVLSFGGISGLDTRGNVASAIAVGDETWAAGDILYAHPTVAGKLTNVKPEHDMVVALITVLHATTGKLAIRIHPGSHHLEWMHDVEIDGPSDREVLSYDSASGLWRNQSATIDSGWTGVTNLSNGFVSGGVTPGYRKLNGVVYMRGNMHQGTADAVAFTLPEGFRPDYETVILAQRFGTATGTYVTILADGSVKPHDDATWLSGISFLAG